LEQVTDLKDSGLIFVTVNLSMLVELLEEEILSFTNKGTSKVFLGRAAPSWAPVVLHQTREE
jgi:hypothetical protein